MSPHLKPLILPQLVEERRKLELQQQPSLSTLASLELERQSWPDDADLASVCFSHTFNSASSDASRSPVTPTFSRTADSRYSGSASSLELVPSCGDSPAPPAPAPAHASKAQLPDVQEEPIERDVAQPAQRGEIEKLVLHPEVEDSSLVARQDEMDAAEEVGLYNCLCDELCSHRDNDLQPWISSGPSSTDRDQDSESCNETDGSQQLKRRRGSATISAWGARIASKIPSLNGRRSERRNTSSALATHSGRARSVASQTSLASSRASSVSALSRHLVLDRALEPPLATPSTLSLFENMERADGPELTPAQLILPSQDALDGLEHERRNATTPLLPPPVIRTPPPSSPQGDAPPPSPLQSPSVATSPLLPDPKYPTPPLSAKASLSSFRRGTTTSPMSPDAPSPIPSLPEHDAWSDRLGHANFTIDPRPYAPEGADLAVLQAFRADWDRARVHYSKHLARTGEHYGATSNTYVLTQEKWAETDRGWQSQEADLILRLCPEAREEALATSQVRRAPEDLLPAAIMFGDREDKFPERGDVDIVGPMERDAVMMRSIAFGNSEDKKNGASIWFKNLADKVRHRGPK